VTQRIVISSFSVKVSLATARNRFMPITQKTRSAGSTKERFDTFTVCVASRQIGSLLSGRRRRSDMSGRIWSGEFNNVTYRQCQFSNSPANTRVCEILYGHFWV